MLPVCFSACVCVCHCCFSCHASLQSHVVEVEVQGPGGFSVKTVRMNPSASGVVTGKQTYNSFLSSLLRKCVLFTMVVVHGIFMM